jgi:hypothetical protein
MSAEENINKRMNHIVGLVNQMTAPVKGRELLYFERIKAGLLKKYKGKFALIMGEELIGVFNSLYTALQEGSRRFGYDIFFVKLISG